MDPAQHLALVVGLADLHLDTHLAASRLHQVDELGVGGRAVLLRLTEAEPAEVRAVEHQDRHAGVPPETAAQAASSQAWSGLARIVGLPSPSRTTKRRDAPRAFL